MALADTKSLYTFISTGDKTAMYTLRVMCLCTVVVGGENFKEMRDYYIQNLSTEKDKAEQKAGEISALLNLEFRGNADFDLSEIRRNRDAMATEKREAAERAHNERLAAWDAERSEQLKAGLFLVGKYVGSSPADVAAIDLGYVLWIAKEVDASGKLGISARIAADWIEANNIQAPGYIGEVEGSIEVTATLKRVFWTQGRFPTLMHIATADSGEEIVFFTQAKAFKEIQIGQSFCIRGMVKDHRDGWGGSKQTVVAKPKLI